MRTALVMCVLGVVPTFSQTPEIALTRVAGGFGLPVDITHSGDGSGRLFVAQRSGIVSIIRNGAVQPQPFLDLGSRTVGQDECGLLGIAFPPGFASKGYFYASHTDATCLTSIIARYRVSASNPDAADLNSGAVLITVPKPSAHHHGGQIKFGPDGFLYASFGDGSLGADPENRAQNLAVLNGKIIRIDTEGAATGPYRIPPGNPFVSNGNGRAEIWALGLRNPWRFSFDRQTGDLWIGDVGQDAREEINFQQAGSTGGQNYGWKIMEGTLCYSPSTNCPSAGLTPPVLDYGRANGDISVIGGYVYRGASNLALRGTYVYADFGSGRIWGLSPAGTGWTNRLLRSDGRFITTFGEDEAGELYFGSGATGEIFRVTPPPVPVLLGSPAIASPVAGQNIRVPSVTFRWQPVQGASAWSLSIDRTDGSAVFRGTLTGSNSLSTVVDLPNGGYVFSLRACVAGLPETSCGHASSVVFAVIADGPSSAPSITAPIPGANIAISSPQFSWTGVAGAASYEVQLTDLARGGAVVLSVANHGGPPATSTIASLRSSSSYQLLVRACAIACGPWSEPVNFAVSLPAAPTSAPSAPACTLQNGQTAACSWNSVTGADIYVLQAIQTNSGPGGGALSVASRRVSTASTTITVPPGQTSFIVAACNGNGCGPYSAASQLNPPGPAPNVPALASPIGGSTLDSSTVTFAWNRIAGDNGSNTIYRLYVQDLQRGAPALDILTKSNVWAAKFRGEGSRHDAVVIANPGLPNEAQGPASGFVVRAASPIAPTMVAPRHQDVGITSSIPSGNAVLGWTPVPGATLYEYWIAIQGQSEPVVRGVTPGLRVEVPLVSNQIPYGGIVRACPSGATCMPGSDASWGPWSNSPGQTGVTTFLAGP